MERIKEYIGDGIKAVIRDVGFWLVNTNIKHAVSRRVNHNPYSYKRQDVLRFAQDEHMLDHFDASKIRHSLLCDLSLSSSELEHILDGGDLPERLSRARLPKYFGSTYVTIFDSPDNPEGMQIVGITNGSLYRDSGHDVVTLRKKSYGLQVDGRPVRVQGDYDVYLMGFIGEADLDSGGIISTGACDLKLTLHPNVALHLKNGAGDVIVDGKKYEGPTDGSALITAQGSSNPKRVLYVLKGAGDVQLDFKDGEVLLAPNPLPS